MRGEIMNQFIKYVSVIIFISIATAAELRQIVVSDLHNYYASSGVELEHAGPKDLQVDGLSFPSFYAYQDIQAAKALWVGCRDYQDPIDGNHYDYKVVGNGPRVVDEQAAWMPTTFELIGKFNHPSVIVDGVPAGRMDYTDKVDRLDADMPFDRMIYNKVNTSMGLTMTRSVSAFTHSDHSNYFINDYVFKNNGIYDLKGNEHSMTLKDVMIFFQYRWGCSMEAADYELNVVPRSSKWGRNQMNDSVLDPFRAVFSWNGEHSELDWNTLGAPAVDTDGHLASPHFSGLVVLHADKSASEPIDDPGQPSTTMYIGSNASTNSDQEQFNVTLMTKQWEQMTAGHPALTQAEDVVASGVAPNDWGTGDDAAGGYSSAMGFGPYTLAPGDSIHLVLAEAVGVLSWEKRAEVGYNWWKTTGDYILPGGGSTTDEDFYKEEWVFTGKDSLFKAFNNAKDAYNSSYTISSPPPPPDEFSVLSGGDRIILEWSSSAEIDVHFAAYRLYRAKNEMDSTYYLIYECGAGTANPIAHYYEDKAAVRGFDYYYYIESVDDGHSGKELVSSIFYTLTSTPAYLRRLPGQVLNGIRIVPNPYHIRARTQQYGTQAGAINRLLFVNLPPKCDIRIYTERGDLIKTIHHVNASGDESWDQISSSSQIIKSGVYIAHIEVTEEAIDDRDGSIVFRLGDSVVKKFIVVR